VISTRICQTCGGAKVISVLPLSAQAIYALAQATPNEPVAAVEKQCPACHGDGFEIVRKDS
jgi:hypothetical protein